MDKYIGRLLDNRYEILEIIGTGGMAVVYKARCHRLNRLVAIKILKDDYLQDEEFRRRFHSESQAVAMLSHPNIVSVYDVSTSIMADYIVMELIDGITLKQYMEKKGVLNWKETLHFAIQIAKALEHAHSRGIVHRDIKPHNIMVLKNGSVKVMDFGIARLMSKGNTLTKEALGSVHYISPEQAKGGRVDSRSDIYSLGVVMYEMMAGRPPYDAESPVSVAIQHINGGAVMPSTLNPNIPGGMEQIIMKAMALNIEQRYSSAGTMLADMDEFRKDPAMLFDYNIPPLDDVTRLTRQVPTKEAAAAAEAGERMERRNTGRQPRNTGSVQTEPRRTAAQAESSVRRRKPRQEESRSNVATVAIITCSLVMVVAIVIFLIVLLGGEAFGPREQLSEVPQLIGKQYSSLGNTYGDFQIKLGEFVYHESAPQGEVVYHNPAAGEMVAKGQLIYVTVSKGKAPEDEPARMEKLEGKTKAEAEAKLNALELDLQYSYREEPSNTVEKGCITRTDPVAGQVLQKGQKIQLWISTGPVVVDGSMPNVVGEKKDAAVKILTSQNLNLKFEYKEEYHSSVQPGFVIETDPVFGTKISTGDTVTLTLSLGPKMQDMPNLLGMDISKAVKILVDAGFATPNIEYVESDKPKDVVVSQSHEKNTRIDLDSKITLQISEGPKPTETTEPSETTQPSEPTQPSETAQPTVTKDVVFDLRGSAAGGESTVVVTRDDVVVYNGTVAKDTASITLTGQTGTGNVKYFIVINDQDGWEEWVEFTGNG